MQARQILDGPAATWVVRGKMNSQGTIVWNYKRPGEEKWENRAHAFVDLGAEVITALDVEKQNMKHIINGKKAYAQRGDDAPARPTPKRRKLAHQASDPSTSRAAAAAGSSAVSQKEVLRITRGAAAGWTVRCSLSQLEPLAWEFQRPNGGTWERLPALQKMGLAEDLVTALQSEREMFASQIRQMLEAPPRGEGAALAEGEGDQSPVHLGSPRDVGDSPDRTLGGPPQPPEVAPEPQRVESTSLRGRKRVLKPGFPLLLKQRQHIRRAECARALAPRRSDESDETGRRRMGDAGGAGDELLD